MLRKLMMLGAGLLILAVVLVVRYDKIHNTEGKGYDIKCAQSSEPSATVGSLICTAEHSQKAQNGESSSPWWHVFFAWPEGITALLLALTLGAIIWQAWETRKAAEAAMDNIRIVMQKERARLSIEIVPSEFGIKDDVWEVELRIENDGPTHAFDVSMLACYVITAKYIAPTHEELEFWPIKDKIRAEGWVTTRALFPGKSNDFTLSDVEQKRAFVHIVGELIYKDVFGAKQQVDFHFLWRSLIADVDGIGESGDETMTQDFSFWSRPPQTNHST
jgi:hypothetical protein